MIFPLILVIFLSLNVYLIHRGWTALDGTGILKPTVLILYTVLSVSLFIGHRLVKENHSALKETFTAFGIWYIGIFLYLILFVVFIDLIRLVNHFFPFFRA